MTDYELESALKRLRLDLSDKRRAMRRHDFYVGPAERRRIKHAQATKRTKRKGR